ncbi:IclR family transcriptional regulator [Caenimonas aquaedulcis]|uniref:Helix-turn-helix domain-containing protein n=1 Tax=Caenimonas aquaedulcis TaxID=2793270 RepID=A0A931MJU2_9BURK|nr:helix-turn-helix domain-containing protein [Caenimonas aquaedulcis]MBG9390680.1 helix-turn-helix domain-containing protein [Caenimonas aquaedulcis]
MTTTPEAEFETKKDGAAAVDRALTIVATLEANAAPMSLAELARQTGMYKSTLLRLIASLERSTLVVRRSDQKYALGPFAFRLGRAFEATHHLERYIMPLMQQLADAGTESPSFHVWHDETTRLCLLRVDSHHSTLDRLRSGDLLPIDRGAPGKVLRAFRNAPNGTADVPLIHTSFGERDPACASLAVPVFGAGGSLVGSMSLSGPRERFSAEALEKMSGPLRDAAAQATRALGGVWPERALVRAA